MERPDESDQKPTRSKQTARRVDIDDQVPGTPIVRTVMREEIKKIVVNRILDGTYLPGARIVESALAREFGTSQAPVREALRDLEGMRLIESVPHKGARVRQQGRKRYLQSYPVRAALEELAGREAALKITESAILELNGELEAMRAAAKIKAVESHLKHDIRFHEIIVEASQNAVLLDLWRGLKVESSVFISAVKMELNLRVISEMHEPIFQALKMRDADLAAKLMYEHIKFFESVFLDSQDWG